MKQTQSAGGVILNKKGQVLVVDQTGSWSLPKGHIEKGENKQQAAKREIYEETGVTQMELIKDLGSYQRQSLDDPNELKTIYMYLYRTNEMKLKPVDKMNPEAKWVSPEEVEKHLTHPKDKEFYLSALSQVKKHGKSNN